MKKAVSMWIACTPSLTYEPWCAGMNPTSFGLDGFEMSTTYAPPALSAAQPGEYCPRYAYPLRVATSEMIPSAASCTRNLPTSCTFSLVAGRWPDIGPC